MDTLTESTAEATAVVAPAPTDPVVLDWDTLVVVEPQLAALEREARRTPFSWRAYESFKSRLKSIVGWHAARDELASQEAWDMAIDRILTALEIRS